MMNQIQEYTISILFTCVGVLAFATFVVFGIWIHKFLATFGFHASEFKKFDAEARRLSSETTSMRKEVELDHAADAATKTRNAELIALADDCDNGVRIALCAWEDIMEPEEWNLDIESKGDKMIKGRRRSHGRWVIKLMRQKVREGMEKRSGMDKEMQSMFNEVMSRKIDLQANLFNRRVASGHEIKSERTVLQPEPRRAHILLHALRSIDMSLDSIVAGNINEKSSSGTGFSGSSVPVADLDHKVRLYTKTEN